MFFDETARKYFQRKLFIYFFELDFWWDFQDLITEKAMMICFLMRLPWFIFWWYFQDLITEEAVMIRFHRRLPGYNFRGFYEDLISEEAVRIWFQKRLIIYWYEFYFNRLVIYWYELDFWWYFQDIISEEAMMI